MFQIRQQFFFLLMRKPFLSSTRFIVTCSLVVLTAASIVGSVMYLRSVRPTLFGFSGSSGDAEALNRSLRNLFSGISKPGQEDPENSYTSNEKTDADTDADRADERIVDAQDEINEQRLASEKPFGAEPPANMQISLPVAPELNGKKLELLTKIPEISAGTVSLEEMDTLTFTKPGTYNPWSSAAEYTVKILKVNNIFKKARFHGMVVLFTKNVEKLALVTAPSKFESLDSLKSLVFEFSSKISLYDRILPDDYQLIQSESAKSSAILNEYFEKRIKKEAAQELFCFLKKAAVETADESHIAVLLNNRVDVFLDIPKLDSTNKC
jgi:hypothetical protein